VATGLVYLTLDQVLSYHEMALAAAHGSGGLRSYAGLASAVAAPGQTFGGDDLYPTIPLKAAAYGFFIAESQAFVDGNKRTAAIAMLAFLSLNGYEFHQTDDEMEAMLLGLGNENSDVDQNAFFDWVCQHASECPKGHG